MLRPTAWCLLAASLLLAARRPPEIEFRKHTLDLGANETCAVLDVNGDGRLDILSGENWYEGPTWKRHPFRELHYANNYVDAFSDLPLDVDGDGRLDIVTASWFSRKLAWWRNPGAGTATWSETAIESGFPVEFAFLVDLDNDGQRREVLPQFGDAKAPLAWYEAKDRAFVKHVVSPQSYGHGIGAGDVNGDGRADILTPKGWLEAPADPRSGPWAFHPAFASTPVAALGFLHVMDVDGDRRNDVVVSNAHDYGLAWFQQVGPNEWKRNVIDDSWSQGHATTLEDLNGDGQPELVTGKRYMAHNGRDPGEREPLGVYWYEFRRDQGRVEWVRHVADYSTRTGGGMQIPVRDLDNDGDPDFVVAGKSGLYLFENMAQTGAKPARRSMR